MIGTTELMIVLVIVLVLFGGSRLPALMEGLGKGLRSFKRAVNGQDEVDLQPRERSLEASARERVELDAVETEQRRKG
jgi:sec-independent protein translocase protein TatA